MKKVHIIDGRSTVYTICPRGHVDEEKPPGFGLNVTQGSETVFYKLCRVCYHHFFVSQFPAKILGADASRGEAEGLAAEWKAETEAEIARKLAGMQGGQRGTDD